jgi:hypothetical protein
VQFASLPFAGLSKNKQKNIIRRYRVLLCFIVFHPPPARARRAIALAKAGNFYPSLSFA